VHDLSTTEGGFLLSSVHSSIKSHTRLDRNLSCTQESWSLFTGLDFWWLSALLGEEEGKVKGVRESPQSEIA